MWSVRANKKLHEALFWMQACTYFGEEGIRRTPQDSNGTFEGVYDDILSSYDTPER